MIQFNIYHDKVVKFYHYRTALLKNWIVKIDLTDNDLQEVCDIIEASGFRMDNHICFSTDVANFMYSDGHLYVGGEIVEGGW